MAPLRQQQKSHYTMTDNCQLTQSSKKNYNQMFVDISSKDDNDENYTELIK